MRETKQEINIKHNGQISARGSQCKLHYLQVNLSILLKLTSYLLCLPASRRVAQSMHEQISVSGVRICVLALRCHH